METKHPLLEKASIKTVRTWKEWREAWDSTNQLEFLHSLLHSGFEIDIGIDSERDFKDHEDRILFYLRVAEGHSDRSLDSYHPVRKLAIKAFKVLCTSYFKSAAASNINRSLSRTSLRELKIHEAVLHFFRPEEDLDVDGRLGLQNLPSPTGHHADIVSDFLSELIRLCWNHKVGWHEPLIGRTPLRQHRPRYVEILMGLDMLDMLLLRRAPNLDLLMDDASMDKLRELALKPHRSLGGGVRMHPESVEHAASMGSKAAQTYLVLQAMSGHERRDNSD